MLWSFLRKPLLVLVTFSFSLFRSTLFDTWPWVHHRCPQMFACPQMFRDVNVTLKIAKQFPILNSLQQAFFCKGYLVRERFSQMLLDEGIRPVQFPPFTFPHFYHVVTFVANVGSPHLIHLPSFASSFDFFLAQRWTRLQTGTVVVVATHCFKDSIAVTTETVRTEAINFLLGSGCNISLNFTFGTNTLI